MPLSMHECIPVLLIPLDCRLSLVRGAGDDVSADIWDMSCRSSEVADV